MPQKRSARSLIPTVVAILSVLVTVAVWRVLVLSERQADRALLEEKIDQVSNEMLLRLKTAEKSLVRMADRWSVVGGTPREIWEADAHNYWRDVTGIEAVEWVDPSYHVRWIVPLEGNEEAQDLDLAADPQRRAALDAARLSRKPTATRTIELKQRGRAFLLYVPIYEADQFDGFILGVYRVHDLFHAIIGREFNRSDYLFEVIEGPSTIYESLDYGPLAGPEWASTGHIDVRGVRWNLAVTPTKALLDTLDSPVPNVILVAGLLVSVLLAAASYLYQQARTRAAHLAAANERLRVEADQRKRTEAALTEEEAQNRAILDAAVDPIITIDPHGTMVSANPATTRVFGYEPDALMGKNVKMLMPPPYHDEHDGYLERYLSTGEARIIGIGRTVVGKRADGTTFPMELSVSEAKVGDKRLFTGIVRDITERSEWEETVRKIQVELRSREVQNQAILDAAVDPIITIETDGTVISANPATTRVFGYEPDAVIGQNVKMLMPSPYHDEHDEYLRRYLSTGEARIIGIGRTVVGRRADGSTFPMELSVNEVSFGDKRLFTGIVRDITERKDWEDSLNKINAELQARNSEMERFVYTVSHDLKSPIVTILGYVGYLREDLEHDERDGLMDAVERIERASHRMRQTIDDLLELSRVGRVVKEFEVVDMGALFDAVVEEMSGLLNERGIEVARQPDLPAVVFEPVRVRQAVENLVVNAVKYGCDGPDPRIDIGGFVEHGQTVYFVRDYGPGVPAQYQEKIFDLFQRLDTGKDGTGIGLAIVRRIMEVHGGTVSVESPITSPQLGNPGPGTAFWLRFSGVAPAATAAAPKVEAV